MQSLWFYNFETGIIVIDLMINNQRGNMKGINSLLVILISSLAITGLSFIDDQIWNVIFIIVGMTAYGIVGLLFSAGILKNSKEGKDAYAFVFFLLLLGGWGVYQGLLAFKNWVLSWHLAFKILVPVLIIAGIVIVIILMIRKKKNEKLNETKAIPSDSN